MTAPYMPLFISEYLADTAHLSTAEHGAYLLLIMNYWQRGKPLPADRQKLSRIARMTDAEWKAAEQTISEFFQERDGFWSHRRIDSELSVVVEKSAKAKASARASVNARSTNAQRTLNERSTNVELLGEDRKGKVSKKDITLSVVPKTRDTLLIETRTGIARAYENAGHMPPDTSRAGSWIEEGFTPDEIISVITGVLQRGKIPSTLKYFDKAIADIRTEPRAPPRRSTAIGRQTTASDYISNELRKFNDGKSANSEFSGITIDAS